MEEERITDEIYEAALMPELWPRLLERLSARFDGVCAVLLREEAGSTHWVASAGFDHLMEDFARGGWAASNRRLQRVVQRRVRGFTTIRHVLSREEIVSDPAFDGFYRPHGIGDEFGFVLRLPTEEWMALSVQRAFDAPAPDPEAWTAAEALRPHLARAALVSTRLGVDRARGSVEVLDALGLPAAVLSNAGRLVGANARFEALLPTLARGFVGRLRLHDRDADKALSAVLCGAVPIRASRSIPLRDAAGRPAAAHLVPIAGGARDVFAGASWVLVVSPATGRPADPTLLSGLFGLTPAEARLAAAVAGGVGSLPEVADAFGLSRETVRSQMRAVLAKTGTPDQRAFIALVSGLAAGSPPPQGGIRHGA